LFDFTFDFFHVITPWARFTPEKDPFKKDRTLDLRLFADISRKDFERVSTDEEGRAQLFAFMPKPLRKKVSNFLANEIFFFFIPFFASFFFADQETYNIFKTNNRFDVTFFFLKI